ncbi:hypothetical protein [Simiduia agarivorans]|nr:hypothetical protein [Simiduia agarivorans]
MDRSYLLTGLGYAIVGLLLGIHMAASKNHGQLVTHAHIMLVGFLLSFVYALCYKLWLGSTGHWLEKAQFYLYQLATPVLLVSLFLLYGQFVAMEVLDPILAIASIAVLLSLVCLKVLVIMRVKKSPAAS